MSRRPRRVLHGLRLIAFLVAVLGLAGAIYGANRLQINRNSKTMIAQAKKAEERGDPGEAQRIYAEYLNFRPRDASALAEYVASLERTSDNKPRALRALLDAYERLLRLDPDRKAEREKLVRLLMAVRFYPGAKDHIEVLLDPERGGDAANAEWLLAYAICEERLGRSKESLERLRQAVATRNAPAEAYMRLADGLRKSAGTKEEVEDAERVVEQLLLDKPNDVTARLERVKYFLRLKRADEANKELDAARKAVPAAEGNAEFALMTAELRVAESKFTEARDVIAKAVATNPDNARLKLVHAELLVQTNDLAMARKELQAASALLPPEAPLALEALDRQIDLGMIPEAKTALPRYESKSEYKPLADYLAGRVALAEGNWPSALPRLQAAVPALEQMPRFGVKARAAIGECYRLANNPDLMLAAHSAALKLDPDYAPARIGQAEAYVLLNRTAEANAIYKQFAGQIPAARAAVVRQSLENQLARPASRRNWPEFEASLGGQPYPAEVVLLHVESLVARNDVPAALKTLRDAAKSVPQSVPVRAALALLLGQADTAAGLAALDEAGRDIGDRVEFRTMRARLLAKTPEKADEGAIADLGRNATNFSPAERFRLYSELGGLFAGVLNNLTAATTWYARAAAENPFHLGVRVALFELAVRQNRARDADAALASIRELEGPNGPTAAVADAIRQLATVGPNDRKKLLDLRASVATAVRLRPSWGRAHALGGTIDELLGDGDAALVQYRRAFDLNERPAGVVRQLVKLLFERNRYEEARRTLEIADQTVGLPTDLRQRLALIDVALTKDPRRVNEANAAAATSTDAADHLFRGQALMMAGDRAAAAVAFEKAVALNPASADGWVNLVSAHVAANQADAARAAYGRAEKQLPSEAAKFASKGAVPTALGMMREALGETAPAEAAYRQAIEAAPTDALANRQLVSLLVRAGRGPEAKASLEKLMAAPAADSLKLWARRALANLLVDEPRGFRNLDAALKLLDQNIALANRPEDQRAKAFLLANDPFRRAEARLLLERASRNSVLAPEELVQRARLALTEGDLTAAEDDLRDATRTTAYGASETLAILLRVQLARGRLSQAAETLARLKKSGMAAWPLAAEEARYLVKSGKRAEAYKLLTPGGPDVAAVLLELDFRAEAEALHRAAAKAGTPEVRAGLAQFLVATARQAEAIDAVRSWETDAFPVPLAARIVTVAVATRPMSNVPAEELPQWKATLAEVNAWATAKLATVPADRDLLMLQAVLADVRGQYADAIASYEKLVAVDDTNVAALNNLAMLLATHAKETGPRPAVLIAKAIAIAGPRSSLLDTRAAGHIVAGRFPEAIRDLEAALAQEQKPTYYFHLALAYEGSGNAAEAARSRELAARKGLKKEQLHPSEWANYERLVTAKGG